MVYYYLFSGIVPDSIIRVDTWSTPTHVYEIIFTRLITLRTFTACGIRH